MKQSNITTAVESISPHTAYHMLKTNNKNRSMDKYSVMSYKKQMEDGTFILNGETIKICNDGNLLDGQHRLQAIVDSGLTIDMLVVRGLPKNSFETIDIGKKRTSADILTIEGFQPLEAAIFAAAARSAIIFELTGGLSGAGKNKAVVSPDRIASFVRSNDDFLDACNTIYEFNRKGLIFPLSAIIFFLYRARMTSPHLADKYAIELITGENISVADSAYAVRTRVLNSLSTTMSLSTRQKICLIAAGWKYIELGKPIPKYSGNMFQNYIGKLAKNLHHSSEIDA